MYILLEYIKYTNMLNIDYYRLNIDIKHIKSIIIIKLIIKYILYIN